MEKAKISACVREKTGKETAKKVRQNEYVPCIIYGRGSNIPAKIYRSEVKTLRDMHFSESALIDLEIDISGKKDTYPVVIKEVQYHPVNEKVIHIDFMRISLDEKIKVNIPVILQGEPKGVKEGGVLEQLLREIEIEALPNDIPEEIKIDVSNLDIGNSIHVQNIVLTDKIRIITHAEDTVVIVSSVKEEVVESTLTAGAPTPEPEVIKEKKPQEKEKTEKTEKSDKKE